MNPGPHSAAESHWQAPRRRPSHSAATGSGLGKARTSEPEALPPLPLAVPHWHCRLRVHLCQWRPGPLQPAHRFHRQLYGPASESPVAAAATLPRVPRNSGIHATQPKKNPPLALSTPHTHWQRTGRLSHRRLCALCKLPVLKIYKDPLASAGCPFSLVTTSTGTHLTPLPRRYGTACGEPDRGPQSRRTATTVCASSLPVVSRKGLRPPKLCAIRLRDERTCALVNGVRAPPGLI